MSSAPIKLFHGSSHRFLKRLEPGEDGVRSRTDGPLVFASSNSAIAALFTIKVGNWRVLIGNIAEVVYYVCDNEAEFKLADQGGAIYELSPAGFTTDIAKGLGGHEWVTTESVTPLNNRIYDSALEAMLDNGVQLFFVSPSQLNKMEAAPDYGLNILRTLTPVNYSYGINFSPLDSSISSKARMS